MRAHSTGHTSAMGRSQITMPPEWMPMCQGQVANLQSQVDHLLGDALDVG